LLEGRANVGRIGKDHLENRATRQALDAVLARRLLAPVRG
jgi:hypothetical protein